MFSKILPFALAAGFMFFGIQAYNDAKPESRDMRVYNELKPFIPYKIAKRAGGLNIISTKTDIKEKPPAAQVYHRLDQLEKFWGKSHLKLDGNTLTVLDDDNKTVKTIMLQNTSEMNYVKNFFGL